MVRSAALIRSASGRKILLQSHLTFDPGEDRDVKIRRGKAIYKLHHLLSQPRVLALEDQSDEVLAGMARDSGALEREAGDLLLLAVFPELEILAGQVSLEVALLVDHDGIHEYLLRTGTKRDIGRSLCQQRRSGATEHRGNQENGGDILR
jgi:hypothetical protein